MARAPSSAGTIRWAPPRVLRLEERLGWGHPAEGRGTAGPTARPPRGARAAGGAERSPRPQCGRRPRAWHRRGRGPRRCWARGGVPLRSEAAAGMPICVGRGQSLAACPARLPPGQLAVAVSHPSGMAHAPPRDSHPTGPAGSALWDGSWLGGRGGPQRQVWGCPPHLSGLLVPGGHRRVGWGSGTGQVGGGCPQASHGCGALKQAGPRPVGSGAGSGRCGPPLTCPRGRAGDELELIRPGLYRNVARQLNVSPHSETAVTSAFLAVAAQLFSAGGPAWDPGASGARPGAAGWCGGRGASPGSEDGGPSGPPAQALARFFSALAGSAGAGTPGRLRGQPGCVASGQLVLAVGRSGARVSCTRPSALGLAPGPEGECPALPGSVTAAEVTRHSAAFCRSKASRGKGARDGGPGRRGLLARPEDSNTCLTWLARTRLWLSLGAGDIGSCWLPRPGPHHEFGSPASCPHAPLQAQGRLQDTPKAPSCPQVPSLGPCGLAVVHLRLRVRSRPLALCESASSACAWGHRPGHQSRSRGPRPRRHAHRRFPSTARPAEGTSGIQSHSAPGRAPGVGSEWPVAAACRQGRLPSGSTAAGSGRRKESSSPGPVGHPPPPAEEAEPRGRPPCGAEAGPQPH